LYPLLSDFYPHGEIAQRYGVQTDAGFSDRSIFIVNKNGIISHIDYIGFRNMPNISDVFDELSKLSD